MFRSPSIAFACSLAVIANGEGGNIACNQLMMEHLSVPRSTHALPPPTPHCSLFCAACGLTNVGRVVDCSDMVQAKNIVGKDKIDRKRLCYADQDTCDCESRVELAEATPQFSTDDKCCATCPEGQQKYYSVDMKHGHCGETCIKPSLFGPYKLFEKNLTIADGSTGFKSCAELGWPNYSETVSHGDPLKLLVATLDLYNRDDASNVQEQSTASIVDLAEATTQFSADDMCCATCPGGQQKYYSVDMKHGHCGETCIKPSLFGPYKLFEKNLTIADGSTGFKSCAELGWPNYRETVSHGDPLKLLVATLDLYDRDAVEVLV